MSIKQIRWSEIEDNGTPTGEYICGQYLDSLLRHGDKDEALAHKFVAQQYTANEKTQTVLDMTREAVYIENVTSDLKSLLMANAFVVIEDFDARCNLEDAPTIIITNATNVYPVDFVDY